jgi:hypothetical protein
MDLHFSGNYSNKAGTGVACELALMTFKEGNLHFVYAPALDLTGYGNTIEGAKDSFEPTLQQFVSYGMNKRTLLSELKKLGWKVSKKNATEPPSLVDMLNKNEYLAKIFEEKQYTKSHQNFRLPAFA